MRLALTIEMCWLNVDLWFAASVCRSVDICLCPVIVPTVDSRSLADPAASSGRLRPTWRVLRRGVSCCTILPVRTLLSAIHRVLAGCLCILRHRREEGATASSPNDGAPSAIGRCGPGRCSMVGTHRSGARTVCIRPTMRQSASLRMGVNEMVQRHIERDNSFDASTCGPPVHRATGHRAIPERSSHSHSMCWCSLCAAASPHPSSRQQTITKASGECGSNTT
jgi:hypothetical protein